MRRRSLLIRGIVSLGNWSITLSSSASTISNTGGSVTITTKATRNITYTDGVTETETGSPVLTTNYGTITNKELTLDANASTSDRQIKVTATFEGLTKTITITQPGKTIVSYSDWDISLSSDKINLNNVGDTTTIHSSASRVLTWTDGGTTNETATPDLSTNVGTLDNNELTIPLNASESVKVITVTATQDSTTKVLELAQAASTKVYDNISMSTQQYVYNVPVTGGVYTCSPTYSQTWTWNGVTGTGGTITTGADITWNNDQILTGYGEFTIPSLGTNRTISETRTTLQHELTLNGKVCYFYTDFYQAANPVVAIESAVFTAGTYTSNNTPSGDGVTVNLNNQWQISTAYNPDSSTYTMYESYSNQGRSGGAIMYINLTGVTSFDCYIRSYGESNYDYVIISKVNQTINNSTSYSSSYLQGHSRSHNNGTTSLSGYNHITYSGLNANSTYTVTVIYRKDSSGNYYDDKGYLLIPNQYLTVELPTTGDGIYPCGARNCKININPSISSILATLASGDSTVLSYGFSQSYYSASGSGFANWSYTSSYSDSWSIQVASRGIDPGDQRAQTLSWTTSISIDSVRKQFTNTIQIVQAANKIESSSINAHKQNYSSRAYIDCTEVGKTTDLSDYFYWDGYVTYSSGESKYGSGKYDSFTINNSHVRFSGTVATCVSQYSSNYSYEGVTAVAGNNTYYYGDVYIVGTQYYPSVNIINSSYSDVGVALFTDNYFTNTSTCEDPPSNIGILSYGSSYKIITDEDYLKFKAKSTDVGFTAWNDIGFNNTRTTINPYIAYKYRGQCDNYQLLGQIHLNSNNTLYI